MRARWVLMAITVAGLVLSGCGDDSDDATQPTTTDAPTSSEATTETAHEIGEPVQISDGQTLTLTSIDAAPDTICAPTQSARFGDEERHVHVRGTLEGDGATPRGVDAFLVPGSQSPLDVSGGPGHISTPEVVERSDDAVELEWCFFVRPDEPTWTFVAPAASSYPPGYEPVAWAVNL